MFAVSGNGCETGSDEKAYCFKLTQLIHDAKDLPGICSLGVENRLGIVEHDEYLMGRNRIFDPHTDDLGESGEEMSTGSWELITTDESTVIAKPVLDVIVVQNSKSDGRFPDPPRANECYGF